MSKRAVRLDDNSKRLPAELRERTGLSISSVLKRGLEAFAEVAPSRQHRTPWEIYRELDIGPGSGSTDGAENAKSQVADVIRKKWRR